MKINYIKVDKYWDFTIHFVEKYSRKRVFSWFKSDKKIHSSILHKSHHLTMTFINSLYCVYSHDDF